MKKANDSAQAMQRVKVGMTGLAFVLLLIGLASAIFSSVNRERPVAAIGAAKPEVVANLTNTSSTAPETTPVKEPLAELGVAPSTSPPTPAPPPPAKARP